MPESPFNKVVGIKERLRHKCFPVSFSKVFKAFFHRAPSDDCF